MKKLLVSIICMISMLVGGSMGKIYAADEFLDVQPVYFDGATSTAVTGATTSDPINLGLLKPNGFFSLGLYVNDTDADVDIYYEISFTGATDDFRRPVDINNTRVALIYDDFAEDDGADGDGKEIKPFTPVIAPWIRFVVGQGSLSNDVTGVTLEICSQ